MNRNRDESLFLDINEVALDFLSEYPVSGVAGSEVNLPTKSFHQLMLDSVETTEGREAAILREKGVFDAV